MSEALQFIAALANYQGRTLVSGLENRLRLLDLIILRLAVPFIVYFVSCEAFSYFANILIANVVGPFSYVPLPVTLPMVP